MRQVMSSFCYVLDPCATNVPGDHVVRSRLRDQRPADKRFRSSSSSSPPQHSSESKHVAECRHAAAFRQGIAAVRVGAGRVRGAAADVAALVYRPLGGVRLRGTSFTRRQPDHIRYTAAGSRRNPSAAKVSEPKRHSSVPPGTSAARLQQRQRVDPALPGGNRVRVLQEIDNGSSRVNQYFYETRCSSSNRQNGLPPACSGIDSALYESICYETHVWAYAKVAAYSRSGDGWTFVKIRASCNCGLVPRNTLRRGRRLGLLHDIAG